MCVCVCAELGQEIFFGRLHAAFEAEMIQLMILKSQCACVCACSELEREIFWGDSVLFAAFEVEMIQ